MAFDKPGSRYLDKNLRHRRQRTRCHGTISGVSDPEATTAATFPRWTPSARELDDLELLLNGGFAPPLPGFVDPTDGPPISLVVDAQTVQAAYDAGGLDLVDPEGVPLARVSPTSTWRLDDPEQLGLVGAVGLLTHAEFGPFRRLHLSPEQVQERYGDAPLLAVPVTRALSDADVAAIDEAAADTPSRTVVLLACVGTGMPEDLSGPDLIRATQAAAEKLAKPAEVVAVAAADHRLAPHADPQSANAWLLDSVARAYADETLRLPDEAQGHKPAAVEALVRRAHPPRAEQGAVIFFTGLSGSGKSTLARGVVDHVLEIGDRTVTSLDGDVVRHHLSKGLGFSREDRETNILRIGFVAAEIARHGGLAVCSPIAPFESTRTEVRRMVEQAGGGFVLIHVATPLEECERRDRKGLYAKARRGEIPDFTGISSPYEEPKKAIKVDTTNRLIAECVQEVVTTLVSEGWLRQ